MLSPNPRASQVVEIGSRLTSSTTALERTFKDTAAAHVARFDREHATLGESLSRADSKWTHELNALVNKTTISFADCAARTETLATAVQNHYEQLRHEGNEAAKGHARQLYHLDQTVQANKQNATHCIDQAVAVLSGELGTLSTRCVEAVAGCESRAEILAGDIKQQQDQFTRALSQLDRKHNETCAVTDKRQGIVEEQLAMLQSRVQSNAGTRSRDLDAALKGLDSL